jgi:uncharacterized RDD family membrane protein YckC
VLSPVFPSLFKRIASLFYECVLLIAIFSVVTFVFVYFFGDATQAPKRYFLQLLLWLSGGAYFLFCWVKSGQTLAMQTWHIRLVNQAGLPVSFEQACKRYVLATVFFGASFLWALFDREGLFLHDRLTGSRLILTEKTGLVDKD